MRRGRRGGRNGDRRARVGRARQAEYRHERRRKREDAMKIRLLMAVPLLAALPVASQAQVTVDVAKITCKQFLLDAVAPTKTVAIWLSGYYHGKHGGTVVDMAALQRETDKLEDYCRLNLDMTVMDAVEGALAVSK
jgi:acid stress chaperone HdeB